MFIPVLRPTFDHVIFDLDAPSLLALFKGKARCVTKLGGYNSCGDDSMISIDSQRVLPDSMAADVRRQRYEKARERLPVRIDPYRWSFVASYAHRDHRMHGVLAMS